ncbi:hypothetical protein EDD11_003198 [Mortierella claussenii]|nr:hypothetical protein EDD11_003198 [Mortierella claussenii]
MTPGETPPASDLPTNGNGATPEASGTSTGAPVKLSFGVGKGMNLGKKKAPLVSKTTVAAFSGHQDDKVETHKDELIVGLDGNKIKSLAPEEEAKALVIPKVPNADWRQQILAKRKKIYVPEEAHKLPVEVFEEPVKEVKLGLQIIKRSKVEHHTESGSSSLSVDTVITTTTTQVTEDVVMEPKEETLDEIAVRKIMESTSGEKGQEMRQLVVPGQENVEDREAFQRSLEDLPDQASLEDYEKVPVEEFGAALLRGMGWKGDANGSEAIEYNRRPALLGLGAKPKEPEPITKKYIKPGESRIPQAIKVPERHTTGRSGSASISSSQRDSHRDSRDGREGRDNRDSRDNRDGRDSRDSRDSRDARESRNGRDERGDRSHRDDREHNRRRDRSRDRERERDRDRDFRDKDRDRHRDRDRRR